MNFVFVSYSYDAHFDSPQQWLDRIEGYTCILQQLAKKHTVTRIKPINHHSTTKHNGVTYRFVKYGPKALRFPWKLNRLVKSLQPDVVVVHGLHHPLQVIQLRLLLNREVPIIVQNHAEQPWPGWRKYLQRIADTGIDAYLFASREMGLDWVNKGNLASAKKIHEVMEVSSAFYPMDKLSAKARTGVTGAPAFLWVGRLDQNKDPLNAIKAFLQFTDSCPGARLYMIYHTCELLNEIKTLLDAHPNGGTVNLVGKTPHDELLYWYNSADFMIAASYYEGSGTAVCEAMSCGCVPVLTDIFSFRMMTDNGRIGMLYEAGNQQQLLAALVQTQQMDMEDQKAKTLAYYQSNLSFEAIARRFEEIAFALSI